MTFDGKCLCGSTHITVNDLKPDNQIKCHCTDCQLTSGTSNSTNVLVDKSKVTMTGKLGEFTSKADSGNGVTRVFCTACGCPVAHQSAAFGEGIALQTAMLGLVDAPFTAELFVKNRWPVVAAVPDAGQVEGMMQ
ncbi:hypothetical protein JCM10207_007956 [Rhodosporidiobolus poonsookiae]